MTSVTKNRKQWISRFIDALFVTTLVCVLCIVSSKHVAHTRAIVDAALVNTLDNIVSVSDNRKQIAVCWPRSRENIVVRPITNGKIGLPTLGFRFPPDRRRSIYFVPDNEHLLVYGWTSSTAVLLSLSSGRRVFDCETKHFPSLSSDGRWMVFENDDAVQVLDLKTWTLSSVHVPRKNERLNCLAISNDGKTLARGTVNSLTLWDVPSEQMIDELPKPTYYCAFVDRGLLQATNNCGEIRLFQIRLDEETLLRSIPFAYTEPYLLSKVSNGLAIFAQSKGRSSSNDVWLFIDLTKSPVQQRSRQCRGAVNTDGWTVTRTSITANDIGVHDHIEIEDVLTGKIVAEVQIYPPLNWNQWTLVFGALLLVGFLWFGIRRANRLKR